MTENDIWKILNYKDVDTRVAACIVEYANAAMMEAGWNRQKALAFAQKRVDELLIEKMVRDVSRSTHDQPHRKRQTIEEQINEIVRARKHWLSK